MLFMVMFHPAVAVAAIVGYVVIRCCDDRK
jgi:type III secretory pathway component EscS